MLTRDTTSEYKKIQYLYIQWYKSGRHQISQVPTLQVCKTNSDMEIEAYEHAIDI